MAAASAVQRAAFLEMMVPLVLEQVKKHDGKIFASVALAQAIKESGWGTSTKMIRANAVYGIKVGKSAYHFGAAWKGKAYKTGTTEYYDGKNPTKIVDFFRSYDSLMDATEDYMDMLCHCQRYRPAVYAKSPEECMRAIIKGGYATAPRYAEEAIQLINTYGLKRYDTGDPPECINPYTLKSSLLKSGSRGESVKWLQFELNRHGANLQIDGIFGQKTKLSVILYQKDHGLVQDGIAGKKTIASLRA